MEYAELLRCDGNLTYWASSDAVVCIGTPVATLYALHIKFMKRDGSVLVQFPKFRHAGGVVTVVSREQAASRSINFTECGKVTSERVKYSHHPDGLVLFSQDGKVRSDIRRRGAFSLADHFGKLCQLHAFFPLGGFPPLDDSSKRAYKRPHLIFSYREIPQAVRISLEWRYKSDVAAWGSGGAPIGPRVDKLHSRKQLGHTRGAFFLGQPAGYPLQDHVLVVFCLRVPVPTGLQKPTIIFMGGADADSVAKPGDPAPVSEYIAALYPTPGDKAALEEMLGTIDFDSPDLARDGGRLV